MTGRSRVLAYALALGLIELTTRAVVYALSEPTGLSVRLGGRLGGPRTAVVALVAVGLAALLATAIVALAAMGARERWALADPGARGARPRVRLRAAAARAAALWLGGMLGFTVVENYVHHRAGMGWHGLACLVGPVHRSAIPVTGALAIVASSVWAAAELALGFARRIVVRLYGVRLVPRPRRVLRLVARVTLAAAGRRPHPLAARGPPLPAA